MFEVQLCAYSKIGRRCFQIEQLGSMGTILSLPSLCILHRQLIYPYILDSSHFLAVIFSVFIGAIVVTFNLRVLGATVSFFQSTSILGYCICPLFIALLLVELLKFLQVKNQLISIIIVALAVVWSVFGKYSNNIAAKTFVSINVPDNKKFVALYPIILFYAFIGVMLIYHK